MTEPTLYIVCGLPFSGKTFLSKKISEQVNIVRLSYDELWQEIKDTSGQDMGWQRLSQLAQQRIIDTLKSGHSVIYDTLNDTVRNREVLCNIAKYANAHSVIIFANTPTALIQQRKQENDKTNARHSVSDTRFTESLARFEPPTPTENAIEFTPDQDIEGWIITNIISKHSSPSELTNEPTI